MSFIAIVAVFYYVFFTGCCSEMALYDKYILIKM
jgi:hypothetical protein